LRAAVVGLSSALMSTPHVGYEWLDDRVGNAMKTLRGSTIADTSQIAADDQYLRPIYRTFQQGVFQCLLTALDHLRFLSWSLQNRDEPYPFAQFTLIRTAITAASTALWMLSGNSVDERRIRALEFNLKDIRSYMAWVDTVKAFSQNQNLSADEQARVDAERAEMDRRQDWIVGQANLLLDNPAKPMTRKSFVNRTLDTEVVKTAGGAISPSVTGGFDPAITLLNTWQTMSGYAHARPWAALPGRQLGEIDAATGMQAVTQVGHPDQLLDAAFRGLHAIEEAVRRLVALAGP
jgi:hypothetical protein